MDYKRVIAGYKAENSRLRNFNKSLEEDLIKWENFLRSYPPPIVWHNLKENPKDLPVKDCKNYLAYSIFDKDEPQLYYYIASPEGQWEALPNRIAYMDNSQIEFWCEVPRLEGIKR